MLINNISWTIQIPNVTVNLYIAPRTNKHKQIKSHVVHAQTLTTRN